MVRGSGRLSFKVTRDAADQGPAHLRSGVQQQADTLRLSPQTGLVQRRDGVHSHDVDRRSAPDEELQLGSVAERRRLVHLRPLRPEACGGGCLLTVN